MHVYIEDIGKHEGQDVTIKGWLHNRRSSGKIHFLTVRDGSGFIQAVMSKAAGRRRAVQGGRSPVAGDLDHRHRHGTSRQARAERLRDRRQEPRGRRRLSRLPDHAQGARRRLPARPPPPLDSHRAPAVDPAHPPRDHQRRPRLLQRPRLHPRRHADLHARRLRGNHDAVSGAVLRGSDRVPDTERPALQRGQRDGARPRLLLRPDLPRRKIEDAPPPHRVLDGGTRDGVCRSERRDGSRGRSHRLGRRARARHTPPRADRDRTRSVEARSDPETVSAHDLRRCGEGAAGEGAADPVGRRLRRAPTRRRCRNSTIGR